MSERRDFALAIEHILEDNPSLNSPLLSTSSKPAFPLVGVQLRVVKGVAVGNAVEELGLESRALDLGADVQDERTRM